MRGDIIQGTDLLKLLGQHPSQIAELKSKLAERLKCKSAQVLKVLQGLKRLPPDLVRFRNHLEEAQRTQRNGYIVREFV